MNEIVQWLFRLREHNSYSDWTKDLGKNHHQIYLINQTIVTYLHFIYSSTRQRS